MIESSNTKTQSCPICRSQDAKIIYKLQGVPVHSVLLIPSRQEALDFPTGDIRLAICGNCGFIWNTAFDPKEQEYSYRYEPTQGYSATFNQFHKSLAESLIERHGLHDKEIIEIGCGQGEFLALLCELGPNRGLGFDPAYSPERSQVKANERLSFVQDFFSEKYAAQRADFVCCKMTLEHIAEPLAFMRTVRNTLGENEESLVFFQVPDVTRILQECAFWDIYYEHCSYFSPGSLTRLFEQSGFRVLDRGVEYEGQYLMIEAQAANGEVDAKFDATADLEATLASAADFAETNPKKIEGWRAELQGMRAQGEKAVLWGSGSKAVAFLSTLKEHDLIEYSVDINPHKQGMYLPGGGQEIVAPQFLKDYQPEVVIAMNPVYRREIQDELDALGVGARLLALQ